MHEVVSGRSVRHEWLSEVLGGEVRSCRLEQIESGSGCSDGSIAFHLEGLTSQSVVVIKLPTLDEQARSGRWQRGPGALPQGGPLLQEIGNANPLPPAHPYFARDRRATRLHPGARGSTSPSAADQTIGTHRATPKRWSTPSPASTRTGGGATG